jgi:glycosyltransferase involved in cell wall biosynthesis
VQEAAERLGFDVEPISLVPRQGRAAEFVDLIDRWRRLRALEYDVFHATTAFTGAGPIAGRYVASILDLIPLDVTSHRKTGIKARFFHHMAARADAVLALSLFSAGRIAERLGLPARRIVVAPLPPRLIFQAPPSGDDEQVLARFGISRPYFVAVADLTSVDPRKRLAWLEGVGAALRDVGYALVVAGAGTNGAHTALSNTHGVGRVSDEDLAGLYRRAAAFVYTSAYEGQGLPPLEALACGTPVVAMANTSVPEVVGEAGWLVEEATTPEQAAVGPHSPEDSSCRRLAAACCSVATDDQLRANFAARARAQAMKFSQTRFDQGIVHAYAC